ncbi:MAG: hypothetical protein DKM50_02130 [Candidatus Margulisiibacteriota bacterium]|nr:MAG: hypothetical protein A2X43_06590 [Candidatus Margulisbacteria bacterium GWD2_39_127]OGI05313.1 MAG: hypothetical protein A2X42_03895 [Candidatus Margulisbacteria bacterium GWF2_38_17]OGI10828.1 MAG: hypothetical protein A2X41_05580 [Candidatus Margulisbacteria bacterium GWE2_39_32]PZM83514.1 MAG: hypothetical protein DKM50_02130 [Candidatus Margulisiibacteriota bacterium]HAR64309.1 hypothetical protein [Candidatus Margulisiibacteriota bacterium]
MKKHKVINFSAFSKKENLLRELLATSPFSKAAYQKIDELTKEADIDNFLTIKLKSASIDSIDLIGFIIESYGKVPASLSLTDYLNNETYSYYQKHRVYKMAEFFKLSEIAEPKKSPRYEPGNDIKKTSLLEMLDISEQGDMQAASVVNTLLDSAKAQILDMIDYIGNFDDPRTFNLLKFFGVDSDNDIKISAISQLGFIKNKQSLAYLANFLETSGDNKDIELACIQSLQKIVYSREIDLSSVTPYLE